MKSVTRRDFVRLTALTAAATIAAACQPGAEPTTAPGGTQPTAAPAASQPTAAPAEQPTAAEGPRYSEAPMLADMVKAGTLPPVEERLPIEPLVIPVVEEIGQYGGTWRRCAVGPNDANITLNRVGGPFLVRWLPDASGVIPHIAKSFEMNDDATEYTFFLREGMKWSDGTPFTADDLVFWYEDCLMNKDLTPTVSKWLRDGKNDQPVVLEKVDDYTVKFVFASSYGLFPGLLGTNGADICRFPKHYLTAFHPNYAKAEDLAAAVKAANFSNWWELFGDRRDWKNIEMPSVLTWHPKRVPPDVPVLHERNPYFYAVDPEGNQLPYIDNVQFDVVENADLLNMKAVAGEIDCQFRHINWVNYPLFVENAEKAGYRVFRWSLAEGSNVGIMLNHNHVDKGLRELIETRDFRIALSVALDRAAIKELAYQGLGEPRQASLIPECEYFKPEHATRYAEHDPDMANELLDKVGLTARDGEGFRLRLDGQPLTITIEYAQVFGPWRDVVAMICEHWKAVGVRAVPKEEDRTLFVQRGAANERDAGIWTVDRCATPFMDPYWFQPKAGGYAWAELYGQWYDTQGAQGEEPPEEIKQQFALYDKIKAATPDQLPALGEEYFDRFSEECWVIGTVGVLPHVGVVGVNFRNVPETAVSDVLQQTPNNTAVAQYFFKKA